MYLLTIKNYNNLINVSENGVENQLILYKNMHQVWLELRNKLKI